MMSGISSKFRKLSTEPSSMGHVSLSSGEDVRPSKEVGEPQVLGEKCLNRPRRSCVSSRASSRVRGVNKGKSLEETEVLEEGEEVVEVDDVDSKGDIPDYHGLSLGAL